MTKKKRSGAKERLVSFVYDDVKYRLTLTNTAKMFNIDHGVFYKFMGKKPKPTIQEGIAYLAAMSNNYPRKKAMRNTLLRKGLLP